MRTPVRDVTFQHLTAKHPLVSVPGTGGYSQREGIACIVTVCPAVKSVGHFSGEADGFHSPAGGVGLLPARKEGKQEDNKGKFLFMAFIDFQFIDGFCAYQVLILHIKGLMPAALLLIHFHYQLLVVGNGELGQGKHRPLVLLPVHTGHIVEGTKRIDDLFLHGGTFHDFLVHDLEGHEVHVERHVRGVLHFGMEIRSVRRAHKVL